MAQPRSSRFPQVFHTYHRLLLTLACLIPFGVGLDGSPVVAEESNGAAGGVGVVSFNQDVRPILSNNCFHCHGPDEEHRQAGLRLDLAGDVDIDEIVSRITETDPDLIMPPPESTKKLSAQQIETLSRWVAQGGAYQQHWSFLPPVDHPPPVVVGNEWSDHPLDRFVLERLRELGSQPSPTADKRTLLRRVTMDLTGLPPSREELHDFLADESPQAYERVVDRLLTSPHYGEHQARYWLDLVRFADTNGLHHDHYREMTPYRDWVIRSFNENLGFDEFVVSQVAGDLYDSPTTDQLVASGFNRLHLIIDVGTALPEESFTRNVVDRVSSIGTAFMGLTLECAVCHDHKYDPITQRDFYQLYAFFNNFDGEPETGRRGTTDFKRGLQAPYLELPNESQAVLRTQLEGKVAELTQQREELKARQAVTSKADDQGVDEAQSQRKLDEANQLLAAAETELKKQQSQLDELVSSIPATLVMKEREEIRPAHILVRGNYDQFGEVVPRDTPGFLPALQKSSDVASRMDLARWMVDANNPLTARVAVNRFWQQLFGVGLVRTSEDFGAQGEPPSHPRLLDYLTRRFVENGWDVKALLRSVVLSETYRQSSKASPQQFAADPENRLLGRGSRYRYDGEVIRDQLLSACGLLNPALYGKSVKPPQPLGLWEVVAMPSSYPRVYKADSGDQSYRRSVYSFWKRALPPPQLTIFDAPTRESCIARRERTNTPLQALVLMNEQHYFLASIKFAERLLRESHETDAARFDLAYETITSHLPEQPTRAAALRGLAQFRDIYEGDSQSLQAMMEAIEQSELSLAAPAEQHPELAAWTMLVHSLFNLDRTKTRE